MKNMLLALIFLKTMHKIIFLETYVIQTPVLCMLLDIHKLNV